jgi:hypothetical protein
MPNRPLLPRYRTQILRMWSESPAHQMPFWRFSLEDVSTGVRCGFADLDALIEYLLEQMEQPPEQGQATHIDSE